MHDPLGIATFFNDSIRTKPWYARTEQAMIHGSLRLTTVFNIPVRVHWSFGLLALFIIYVGKRGDGSWLNVVFFGFFVLALFFCVLLHEFGHALSARYFGVSTRDITLLPIGGMARLDKLPENPIHEFVVAIAGPAVNLIIFGLLSVILYFGYHLSFNTNDLLHMSSNRIILNPTAGFLSSLLHANLLLAVFNMIPAFPLDGGRVLRALLSLPFGRARATALAVFLGQSVAIGFFIYALLPLGLGVLPENSEWREIIDWGFQPVLMFISFFVIYTARHEYSQVLLEQSMSQNTVNTIMSTVFTRFQTRDAVFTAIEKAKKTGINDFLVFDDDQILRGILQEEDIKDAEKNKDTDAFVSSYTTTEFQTSQPSESIKSVYERMLKVEQSLFPVLNTEGGVVGIVDFEMIENFMKNEH
jgi:Zn-dependent protease/predicted transcriptional regulator